MLAILVASVALFVFGAIWFTVLFGRTWAKLMDFNPTGDAEAKKMGMKKPLVMNFISQVVVASAVYYLYPNVLAFSFSDFVKIMFVVWLGFSFPIYANAAIWERKTWKLVAINSAQSLLALLIVSSIVYHMQ